MTIYYFGNSIPLFDFAGVQPNPIKIMPLGDSNTSGAQAGGYRMPLYRALRAERGDTLFVGSQYLGDGGRYVLGDLGHDGIGGATIESTNDAFPGYIAIIGQPHLILLMIGSNNVNADTLSTMQSKVATLWATIKATCPAARVIVSSIPPRLDGAGDAVRIAYNAWLASGVVASMGPLWQFVDGCAAMNRGDLNGDLLHLNEYGSSRLAMALLPAIRLLYPARYGSPVPRTFTKRAAQQSANLATKTTDYLYLDSTTAGRMPVTGQNWAYSWWANPSQITTSQSFICSVADYTTGFLVGFNATNLYVQPGTQGTVITSPVAGIFTVGGWTKFMVSYHADTTQIALWANGMLLGQSSITAPTMSATAYFFGYNPSGGINGFTGNMADLQFCKGADVPAFANMRPLVEQNYFENVDLPNAAFIFRLNNSLLDAIGGANIVKSGAGVTFTTVAMPNDA